MNTPATPSLTSKGAGAARGSGSAPAFLRRAGADVGTAFMMAVLAVTFALSHAALIFSGSLAGAEAYGVTAALIACLVVGLVASVFSSLRFVTAGAEGNASAVLAAGAAGIAATLGAAGPEIAAATAIVGIALSAVAIGVALVLLGIARLGSLARYLPYPVVGGFLGATGLFLAKGGLEVGVHRELLAALSERAAWPQIAATIAVAIVCLAARERLRHPFALAGCVAAATLAHWVGFAASGRTVEHLAADGWVLALPAKLPWLAPWQDDVLRDVSWEALRSAAPTLVPLLVVTVISIVLVVTALENVSRRDADINRELTVAGAGSIASGAFGGLVGYHSLARSTLAASAGIDGRRVGILAAILSGALLVDATPLAAAPRPVLGGLVLYLGLTLIRDHVVTSRRMLSLGEWLTVLLVLAATARFGFAVGVLAGVVISCFLFAIAYSRFSPVRGLYTGRVARSSIERREAESRHLAERGDALLIAHVQGYVFFGTADRLIRRLRSEIVATSGRVRHLVLDFSACEGVDGSAAMSLARLAHALSEEGIALCLTGLPIAMRGRLERTGAPRMFETLDDALAWSENERLAEREIDPQASEPFEALFAREFEDAALARALIARLEPIALAPGEVLMRQGERSDALYLIEDGLANVFVQVDEALLRVRTFGPGTLVGEIGFVLGEPRTATVAAQTPCRLLRLTRERADLISREEPRIGLAFQSFLARRLCLRIRDKDGLIEALVRSAPRGGART